MSVDINTIENVRRFENFTKDDMQGFCMDKTHAVYPHDQIYGKYCTLEEYVDCPPEEAFKYLSNPYNLAEWTYSMRNFGEMDETGLVMSLDRIGGETEIYTRTTVNAEAMTVDYHCAWDQGDKLWMIYLMRVIDAQVVFNKPGSVILWTNCRHPYYDANPFPEAAPADRKVWVGDMWPFFYAGHHVEMQNLKSILEYRHANNLPICPESIPGEAA
ncbi:MAG: SRPBCC family protein [Deltaproteobacteria bacterium]|jgi:hypothetical protein|nr:SRPBCC family protein [Deltaproteobacteria bacterium]MBT6434440.1 SRPBCC family protein [Deltaproteobacteria bacterium]MBT6489627.1 SRPBCC family protein [Deltaproteobacteria bacterium]